MTFRERLADWISDGALTSSRSVARFWNMESNEGWTLAIKRASALQEIADMETPNCAPIGKRMAKAARDALK